MNKFKITINFRKFLYDSPNLKINTIFTSENENKKQRIKLINRLIDEKVIDKKDYLKAINISKNMLLPKIPPTIVITPIASSTPLPSQPSQTSTLSPSQPSILSPPSPSTLSPPSPSTLSPPSPPSPSTLSPPSPPSPSTLSSPSSPSPSLPSPSTLSPPSQPSPSTVSQSTAVAPVSSPTITPINKI